MAVSKVILNGTTEIDLTADTATADTVLSGETFHLANGTQATGTAVKGGEPIPLKDVNFYDYDGTILYSYTVAEFAELTELPPLPTHSEVPSGFWNWTLSNIQEQVADTGACDVGAVLYDAHTQLHITLRGGRLSPCLGIAVNGTATIIWGDRTSSTLTGTSLTTPQYITHTYSTAGDYVIKIACGGDTRMAILGSGSYSHLLKASSTGTANQNAVYLNSLTRVDVGQFTAIGNYAFYGCGNLKTITIHPTVTAINEGAFWNCYNLQHLTVPSGVTTIGNNLFRNCYSLRSVSLPKSLTSLGSNLSYDTHSVSRIVLPRGLTATQGNTFYNNKGLTEAYISDTITGLGAGTFQSCTALRKVKMPASVTSFGSYLFSGCSCLLEITLPSNFATIDSSAFSGCSSLAEITIPSNVTQINASAFANCYGLSDIYFLRTTPPTVSNANAFSNLPTDCKIHVPTGTLSAYTSAANYPSSSTYTYVEG